MPCNISKPKLGAANPPRLTRDQWSQYWLHDSVTTFARQFNVTYDGEFMAYWNARVVALATGNGAFAGAPRHID